MTHSTCESLPMPMPMPMPISCLFPLHYPPAHHSIPPPRMLCVAGCHDWVETEALFMTHPFINHINTCWPTDPRPSPMQGPQAPSLLGPLVRRRGGWITWGACMRWLHPQNKSPPQAYEGASPGIQVNAIFPSLRPVSTPHNFTRMSALRLHSAITPTSIYCTF